MKRLLPLLFAVLLVVAACDGSNLPTTTAGEGGASTTTAAPEEPTTSAPPEESTTTAAPEESTTTLADGEGEGEEDAESETPWWVLIIVGLALLVIIVSLVRRGSSKKVTVAPGAPTWKDHARNGYADARWLYDAMSEDVAVWRGNAQFDGATSVGASAATGHAETWNSMQGALDRASRSLYQFEAAAPDNRSATAAQETIASMRAVRASLDSRAEARFAYRKAQSEGADAGTLLDARDREVRASKNLTEARNAFAQALTDLSTLV